MVTLIQCQQTADNNLHEKEQDNRTVNELSQIDSSHNSPNSRVKFEQLQLSKDNNNTVITAVNSNGVINSTPTQCSDINNTKNVVDRCANNGSVEEEEEEEEEEDDDDDEDENDTDFEEEEWTKDLPVSTVVQHQQQILVPNGKVVLPNADPSTFGDICVKNSTNVHLGNKTLYKGPVTIRQFIYSNPPSVENKETNEFDGPRTSDANASDLSLGKTGGNGLSRPILSQKNDYERVKNWLWTWRCAALLCTIALIVVTTIVVASVLLTHRHDVPPALVFPEIPDSSLEGVIVNNVRFIQRNEWGAQPPVKPLGKLKLPVPYVIISHTATEFCTTQSECTLHVRFAQTFHIESRNWSDIGYNFLVGGDGLAYVGRSWDYIGAHAFGYNNKSIGISFIGTFNSVLPPKVQLHAAEKIIELGVKAGKIDKDYKLLGHRQVSKTLSPGDALYSKIKTWPHWVPFP
ncbi:peptidoglycan-recognition protein LC-like isoform X2 [Polistes fuscatus]|nr:peptidoglycan-recognition protein LC-like isoform X2 [Polistes fuscatus]XP_043505215.1 peptidoglycan-recognition protein LC-like isoform X2 [Polistes fuscatus]